MAVFAVTSFCLQNTCVQARLAFNFMTAISCLLLYS
jgi:hypothetical protein